MIQLTPQMRLLVAVAPVDFRRYAEFTVMRSRDGLGYARPGEDGRSTPHNQGPFREGRSDASSLSGARNRPRRSPGGRTASMASSFAVGSART
jgi:hypothetical protein